MAAFTMAAATKRWKGMFIHILYKKNTSCLSSQKSKQDIFSYNLF